MDSEIYKENILEHGEFPRNFKILKGYSVKAKETNPFCGDEMKVYLKIKSNKINDLSFINKGCIISTASASLLTEDIKGKAIKSVLKMNAQDILKLIKIELSPNRIKCAELVLMTIRKALNKYEENN